MSIIEQNRYTQFNLNNIEENCYIEFEAKVESLNEYIITIIENGFKDKKYNNNDNVLQNNDEELKVLVEQNKQLRYSIDIKLNELSQQKNQYENYKKDQKLLSQEIKETHEAFLMAKKYYKKFLKIYYTIESKSEGSQTIFIQFFTEAKKESENYSVRLVRNVNTGCYQLSTVKPKLKAFEELNNKLLETNDVPGALCCIRQAFLKTKMYKK